MSGRGINEMPGRPEGEGTYRIEEKELEEAAHRHEEDEELQPASATAASKGIKASAAARRMETSPVWLGDGGDPEVRHRFLCLL